MRNTLPLSSCCPKKKASYNSGAQSTTARDENTIQHVMPTRIKPFCALFAIGIWK
jgi:hypothetical protein